MIFKQSVFISGNDKGKDNNRQLSMMLKGLGFTFVDVLGSYKGEVENSFQVRIDHSWQVKQLTTIAKVFNQESILVNDQGKCFLLFSVTEQREFLGFIKPGEDDQNYSIIDGVKYIVSK